MYTNIPIVSNSPIVFLFLNKGLTRIWTVVEKPCQITKKPFLFISFLHCFLKEWLSSFWFNSSWIMNRHAFQRAQMDMMLRLQTLHVRFRGYQWSSVIQASWHSFFLSSDTMKMKMWHLGFPVAQMVEHGASNATIMGSIPRESKSW